MSILNDTSDGYYHAMVALFGTLAEYGPMDKDTLAKLCTPQFDSNREQPDKPIRDTLRRWTRAGLFVEEYGIVRISDARAPRSGESHVDAARRAARSVVLDQQNVAGFEKEGADSTTGDFVRGISWLLAQDALDFHGVGWAEVSVAQNQQHPDYKIIVNDFRWSPLVAWGLFLGFLSNTYRLTLDPAPAISEVLPEVFAGAKGGTLPVDAFVNQLSVVLPVLDGGSYRVAIEDRLDQVHWRRTKPGVLSSSLSLALLRLESAGVLVLGGAADAASVCEVAYSRGRRISHVTWSGVSC